MMYSARVFLVISVAYGVISLHDEDFASSHAWVYGIAALMLLVSNRAEEERYRG